MGHILKIKQHKDARINVALLTHTILELFTENGVQSGEANTFHLNDICNHYNANVDAWNKECRHSRRSKLSYLSEASIREYLKKLGLAELAKRLFQRVHTNTSQRDGLEANKALIEALNLCLPNELQVYDLVLYDGCYKKVSDLLYESFKAARTAKQATTDEHGNKQEVKVAQLGIQVGFSLLTNSVTSVDITSATANERDFVRLKRGNLIIMDAGYLSYQMMSEATKKGCFLLVNGKINMVGHIKSIKVDEVDKTSDYVGLNLKDEKIKQIPNYKNLDMQVEVSYRTQTGMTPEGKAIMETVTQCVRVIRCQSERRAGYACFLISNLPETVPCTTVLSLMRTRWQIELYFKELKSLTRFRGALTSSESLTRALVYFSLTAHLCRANVTHAVELETGQKLSTHKLCDMKVSVQGQVCPVGVIIMRSMSCVFKPSTRKDMLKDLADYLSRNLHKLHISKQSKKNRGKSFIEHVLKIVQVAINANPFSHDTEGLMTTLGRLQKMT